MKLKLAILNRVLLPSLCILCFGINLHPVTASSTFRPRDNGSRENACQDWCEGNDRPWKKKCRWVNSCDGCPDCADFKKDAPVAIATHDTVATPVTTTHPDATPASDAGPTSTISGAEPGHETTKSTKEAGCKDFCKKSEKPWSVKCRWKARCGGCDDCSHDGPTTTKDHDLRLAPTEVPPPTKKKFKRKDILTGGSTSACGGWCEKSPRLWKKKCTFAACGGCSKCDEFRSTEAAVTAPTASTASAATTAPPTDADTTAAPTDPPTTEVDAPAAIARVIETTARNDCRHWCFPNKLDWEKKCSFADCSGCASCASALHKASVTPGHDLAPAPSSPALRGTHGIEVDSAESDLFIGNVFSTIAFGSLIFIV